MFKSIAIVLLLGISISGNALHTTTTLCDYTKISASYCTEAFPQSLRNSLYSLSNPFLEVIELNNRALNIAENRIVHSATIASNMVVFETFSEIISYIQFEIHNALEQRALSISSLHSEKIQIDMSNFAAGVYYIHTDLPNLRSLKFTTFS